MFMVYLQTQLKMLKFLCPKHLEQLSVNNTQCGFIFQERIYEIGNVSC